MKTISKVFLVLLALIAHKGHGQAQGQPKQYSAGVRMFHLYDLPSDRFDSELSQDLRGLNGKNTSFDVGVDIFGEVQLTPLIGFQGGLRFAGLTGANDVEYYDNSFQEFDLDMILLLNNLDKGHQNLPLNYYAKLGLGAGSYQTERYLVSDNSLNSSRKSGFWNGRVGAGVQYEYNNFLRLDFEMAYNVAFDDGFDGYNQGSGSDPYLTTGIGVAYTFGDREARPMYSLSLFDPAYIGGVSAEDQKKAQAEKDSMIAEFSQLSQTLNRLGEQMEKVNARMASQEADIQSQEEKIKEQEEFIRSLKATDKDSTTAKAGPVTFWQEELNQVQVYFEFDSDGLTPDTKAILKSALSQDPEKITLIGYASSEGDPVYNDQLKQRRVEMVKTFLISNLGLNQEQIVETMLGDTEEMDEEAYLNRKVMVKYESMVKAVTTNN